MVGRLAEEQDKGGDMLKAITAILQGVGVWLGWRYSDRQVAKREAAEIDKRVQAAQAAAHGGNEDKVNEIINRTLKMSVVLAALTLAGCVSRTVYVDDSAKVIRLENSIYGLLSEAGKRMTAWQPTAANEIKAKADGLDAVCTALAVSTLIEPN